jgi:hypothetical protein
VAVERFRVLALSSRAAHLIGGGDGRIVLAGVRFDGHVIARGERERVGGGEGGEGRGGETRGGGDVREGGWGGWSQADKMMWRERESQ